MNLPNCYHKVNAQDKMYCSAHKSSELSKNTDNEPLYQQVKNHIADKIYTGELAPSDRVPSENELVRTFSVSRMTANRALSELTTEGLLTRIHGVGTFVARMQTTGHLLRVRSIAEEVKERGHAYSFDVLEHHLEVPPPDVSKWMGNEPGANAYRTVIVHKENEIPIQLERRFVNLETAPAYAQIDLKKFTPSEFLLANVPLQRVEHKVRALMPSDDVAEINNQPVNPPMKVAVYLARIADGEHLL